MSPSVALTSVALTIQPLNPTVMIESVHTAALKAIAWVPSPGFQVAIGTVLPGGRQNSAWRPSAWRPSMALHMPGGQQTESKIANCTDL